jgi:hypothetical protein
VGGDRLQGVSLTLWASPKEIVDLSENVSHPQRDRLRDSLRTARRLDEQHPGESRRAWKRRVASALGHGVLRP